jgi:phosphinothricin tripeptide acetyl hydrolase
MPGDIQRVRAHLAKSPALDTLTVAEQRAQYERAEKAFPIPPDVKVEHVTAPAVPAEWLSPPAARAGVAVLYLHGGGYVIGSPRSHRHLAAAIGAAARSSVLLPEYRLAPEHPFPAAVDDAVAAYRWLLDRPIAPGKIVIAGDSAGGGLTVATLVALREARVPLPAAAVCLSPWTDLSCSGKSYRTRAAVDPIVTREGVGPMATAYLAGTDAKTVLASPLFADLHGLPPLLIQVGDAEVLLDDATVLAERARKAGVDATLEVWPEMIHVWHWFFPMLDDGQRAIDRIGAFIRARTA